MFAFRTNQKIASRFFLQRSPAIILWPDCQNDPVAIVISRYGTFEITLTDAPAGLYPIVIIGAYSAEWHAGAIEIELDCPYHVESNFQQR